MQDLQLAYIRDIAPVYQADVISMSPVVLRLFGADFTDADAVLYDGEELLSFRVVSPTIVDVTVPDGMSQKAPKELAVLTRAFTSTPTSTVQLRADRPGRRTEGAHRAFQQFLLLWLTTPGSSVFRPTVGGGALALLQKPRTDGDHGTLAAALTQTLQATVQQLQSGYRSGRIPLDEQIVSATLAKTVFLTEGGVRAEIMLRNAAGSAAYANVGM